MRKIIAKKVMMYFWNCFYCESKYRSKNLLHLSNSIKQHLKIKHKRGMKSLLGGD